MSAVRPAGAMRSWFRDANTKTKLMVVIMVAVLASLLFTGVTSLAKDFLMERKGARANLEALAGIISSNSTAALTFRDEKAIREIMSALRVDPNIVVACLYDSSFRVAGSYARRGELASCPADPAPRGQEAEWGSLFVVHPVLLEGRPVGSLYIKSDLGGMFLRLRLQALEILLILLLATVFGYLLSRRLQYFVSRPILELAQTAKRISSNRDYSIRAVKRSQDEMAHLIDAFNHMLTVIEDSVAERERLLAEARAAVRVRDDFIAIASHELRTPLTSLKAQVQILEKLVRSNRLGSYPEERLERLLASAGQQVGRLASLINDLLDVTRISAGRFPLNREQVDFDELVREVIERFRSQIESSGSEVRLRLEARSGGCWDRLRVEQVLINLLTNAIKYGQGKPILVSTRSTDRSLVLCVEDQGVGIGSEDQARIFGRFERAVSLRHFGGLGLGLYIVAQIVEAHQGKIRVESRPGEGARFWVELPLEPPTERPNEEVRSA